MAQWAHQNAVSPFSEAHSACFHHLFIHRSVRVRSVGYFGEYPFRRRRAGALGLLSSVDRNRGTANLGRYNPWLSLDSARASSESRNPVFNINLHTVVIGLWIFAKLLSPFTEIKSGLNAPPRRSNIHPRNDQEVKTLASVSTKDLERSLDPMLTAANTGWQRHSVPGKPAQNDI